MLNIPGAGYNLSGRPDGRQALTRPGPGVRDPGKETYRRIEEGQASSRSGGSLLKRESRGMTRPTSVPNSRRVSRTHTGWNGYGTPTGQVSGRQLQEASLWIRRAEEGPLPHRAAPELGEELSAGDARAGHKSGSKSSGSTPSRRPNRRSCGQWFGRKPGGRRAGLRFGTSSPTRGAASRYRTSSPPRMWGGWSGLRKALGMRHWNGNSGGRGKGKNPISKNNRQWGWWS